MVFIFWYRHLLLPLTLANLCPLNDWSLLYMWSADIFFETGSFFFFWRCCSWQGWLDYSHGFEGFSDSASYPSFSAEASDTHHCVHLYELLELELRSSLSHLPNPILNGLLTLHYYYFWNRVSLCISSWPGALYVDKTSLELYFLGDLDIYLPLPPK